MINSSLFIMIMALLLSCNSRDGANNVSHKELKEPLIEENQKISREENHLIERYIERHNLEMAETGTGLRYWIYHKGPGILAENGMTATVEYEMRLLDGSLVYTSLEKGPKSFVIGKDNVESGVHEAVLLMHVGDKGKFIIPSHLAHGLLGDQRKIPPRATLVVDLNLRRLN